MKAPTVKDVLYALQFGGQRLETFPGESQQYAWRPGSHVEFDKKLRKDTLARLSPELRPLEVAA